MSRRAEINLSDSSVSVFTLQTEQEHFNWAGPPGTSLRFKSIQIKSANNAVQRCVRHLLTYSTNINSQPSFTYACFFSQNTISPWWHSENMTLSSTHFSNQQRNTMCLNVVCDFLHNLTEPKGKYLDKNIKKWFFNLSSIHWMQTYFMFLRRNGWHWV